ncbi:Alg9-like mannosyltransferase family-domain-containing protein [Morchella snyderi]|nr:Alg9-like mannosyltransferase family-domain-containing protein [Morchella snyderi]
MAELRARTRPVTTPAPAPAIPTNPRLAKKKASQAPTTYALLPSSTPPPSSQTKLTPPPPPNGSSPLITPTAAFALLLIPRLLSARYATIPDCDEVFNFWEPAHYLSHAHGLQTWEYSPVYAIRSWAYILLHSALSRPASLLLLGGGGGKRAEFYALRVVFAVACAYAESRLYRAVVGARLGRGVAALFLAFAVGSAGMFHSAVAFLPSTFAMYTGMLAAAGFLEGRLVAGVVWTAVGGLLGWPFCLVMCVPWVLGALGAGLLEGRVVGVVARCVKGGLWSAGLLAVIVAIDSAFYRKLEIVPLNIVLYNVFSDASRGPNIYGTEPWHFYLLNLTLNHNILLPLSLAALPALALAALTTKTTTTTPVTGREITATLPYYLWLAIFTLQPHKEERFMFPAYPLLLLNAAIALSRTLDVACALPLLPRSPPRALLLRRGLAAAAAALTALLSLSRTLAVTTAYAAPMSVYDALPADAAGNLCVAGEWYRFPSHYLLPEGVRAKWLVSGFGGLLPGEFAQGGGWREGTWRVPRGMNDRNVEDEGKYLRGGRAGCEYIVGLGEAEGAALVEGEGWVVVARERFLDKEATGLVGRVFWVPGWLWEGRRWEEYWIVRRGEGASESV